MNRSMNLPGNLPALFLTIMALSGMTGSAFAAEKLSYSALWSKVKERSPIQRGASLSVQSAEIARSRASRHWFPRLYLDARAFSTQDPGLSLISKMSARSVTAADFSPDLLNHPTASMYGKITLGAEISLYEGGARIAQSAYQEKNLEAEKMRANGAMVDEYGRAAAFYGSLIVFQDLEDALKPLLALTDSTIARYQVGAKTNPLGHSGLLGLQTLSHRITSELISVKARRTATYSSLKQMATLPAQWLPVDSNLENFIHNNLEVKGMASSYTVQAERVASEAMDALSRSERARFLPRAGLFTEGHLYSGNQSSASAYTAGAFLKWDLFSAPNFGAVRQAELTAQAAESRADAIQKNEAILIAQLSDGVNALREQIELASKSLVLMDEQSRIAQKLFVSGSINALQLTEVLSRRVDLTVAKSQAEERYLKSKAELINYFSSEIPGLVAGGEHE